MTEPSDAAEQPRVEEPWPEVIEVWEPVRNQAAIDSMARAARAVRCYACGEAVDPPTTLWCRRCRPRADEARATLKAIVDNLAPRPAQTDVRTAEP